MSEALGDARLGRNAIDSVSQEIGETMKRIQQRNFDAHGHYYRGTHVSYACIV